MQISVILNQADLDTAVKEFMIKRGYTVQGELKYDSAPGRCTLQAEHTVKTKPRQIETEQ